MLKGCVLCLRVFYGVLQAVLQRHAPGGPGQEVQLRVPGEGSGTEEVPPSCHHRVHEGTVSLG